MLKLRMLFFSLLALSRFSAEAQSWKSLADFPGQERDDGVAFVIGNKAFCGTGAAPGKTFGDFFVFDMNSENWSPAISMPANEERQYACGFSYGNKGFVVAGFSSGNFLNDVWKFDIDGNAWTEMSAIPADGRSGAACFSIGNTAYVIGGSTASREAVDEVWAYDMTADSWVKKSHFPSGGRWRATATSVNEKGYLIFGRDENLSYTRGLFEYDAMRDVWTKIGEFPGTGRTYASLQCIAGELILITGYDSLGNAYDDMWSYNPIEAKWRQLKSIPSTGRRGGIGFHSNNTVFYTTGIDMDYRRLKETWKYYNPAGNPLVSATVEFSFFPNPARNNAYLMYLDCELDEAVNYSIFDTDGRIILESMNSLSRIDFNLLNFRPGLYFLKFRKNDRNVIIKFVKI